MSRQLEPKGRNGDATAVRARMWVFVVGLVLLSELTIVLLRPQRQEPSGRFTSSSNAVQSNLVKGNPNRGVRGTVSQLWLAATAGRFNRTRVALTAPQARELAMGIANEQARELYGFEPFGAGADPRWVDEQWVWSERQAWGSADVEATVKLPPDGSKPTVELNVFDSGGSIQ